MNVLLLHILAAIAGIAAAAWLVYNPSKVKLYSLYTFTGIMFLTGFLMMEGTASELLHAIILGTMYLAIVFASAIYANRKYIFH